MNLTTGSIQPPRWSLSQVSTRCIYCNTSMPLAKFLDHGKCQVQRLRRLGGRWQHCGCFFGTWMMNLAGLCLKCLHCMGNSQRTPLWLWSFGMFSLGDVSILGSHVYKRGWLVERKFWWDLAQGSWWCHHFHCRCDSAFSLWICACFTA